MLTDPNAVLKKRANPFEGAVKRRIKARQAQVKQAKPPAGMLPVDSTKKPYENDEPDITQRRKRMGY